MFGQRRQEAVDLLTAALAEPDFGAAAALAARVEPVYLDLAQRCDYLSLCGRLENQAAARKLAAVASVAGFRDPDEPEDVDTSDCLVAAALHLSAPAAECLIHLSARAHARLPQTAAAMHAGRLSPAHVRGIVDASWVLPDELLDQFEDRVVDKSCTLAPGKARALANRTVNRLDPDGLARREQTARADADVYLLPTLDGVATLHAVGLLGIDAATVKDAVDTYARSLKAGGDERTLGQLRGAALVAWASSYLHGQAPTSHGRPVEVQVVTDLPTLLGLTDHPCEVGHGLLVPADRMRELLAEAATTLRWLVINPTTGHLTHHDPTRYRVSPEVAAAVAARYRTATSPGSTSPARASDLDHAIPHCQGGQTALENLHAPTRHWHNAKTNGGWTTTINTDGTVTWTSPTGQRTTVEPHDYRLGP